MDTFSGVEIFRAGQQTDSAGRAHVFSEADLDRIVASYDPKKHEAPLVIGHPEHNAPAFGWVAGLRREGGILLADFQDVQPEFSDMVKRGLFKKRSISLYPDKSLRHVGFLGAAAPAVKGLRDVAFNEPAAICFEFADGVQGKENHLARTLARLRQWISTEFGEAKADLVLAKDDIQQLLTPAEPKSELAPEFQEDQMTEQEIKKLLEPLEAKVADFNEKMTAKDKEIEKLAKANETLAGALDSAVSLQRQAGIASFCEKLVDEGRLTPFQAAQVKLLLPKLDSAKIEFSEGDKKVEKLASVAFEEFLKGLPVQVDFSEAAKKGKAAGAEGDPDPDELAGDIQDFMQKAKDAGRKVSHSEALAAVMRQRKEGKK